MCEFPSWTELGGRLYYLTAADLATREGRALRKHLGAAFTDDIKGHGAIDYYHGLQGSGRHCECTDFSSPANFPAEIVEAIKSGAFRGIGVAPELLGDAARAEFDRVWDAAMTEHNWVREAAGAEYDRGRAAARAEFDRVRDAAMTEHNWVREAARVEYDRVLQKIFWDLFADPANRVEVWR